MYCQLTAHFTLLEAVSLSRHIPYLELLIISCSDASGSPGLPSGSCSAYQSQFALCWEGRLRWGKLQGWISVSDTEMSHLIIHNSLIHESSPCTKCYVLAHQGDKKYTHTHRTERKLWRACAFQTHIGHLCHSVKCKAESLKVPLRNVCNIAYQSPSLFTSLIQPVFCSGKLK